MNLSLEEKTKSSSLPPSLSVLPDEITVSYLARIPRSYYPRLSSVSKSFRSILSSNELYAERSRIGTTDHCLYVCFMDYTRPFPQWFRLGINPNRTIGLLLLPIPLSKFPTLSKSAVAIGSEIYLIGGPVKKAPSSAVQILDHRSHTWRDAPSMNVARENASSCFYDGKIYVFGGLEEEEDEPWAEVFDIKTQTWERLSDPGIEIPKCSSIHRNKEMEGKIYLQTMHTTYAYDTKQGKWECCEEDGGVEFVYSRSECVMGNVSYCYDQGSFGWYDIKDGGSWKEIKGLDSLKEHIRNHGSRVSINVNLVSCGGKLLFIWAECNPNGMKKIWCAEIVVEKRDGGEVWGNVECVDVLRTIPRSSYLRHALVVSV